MSTETMNDNQLNELDQMMGWDFTQTPKGNFEENAVVPDGWYWMRLVRIGKPYLSKDKRGKDLTKCVFEYLILAEADKKNQKVESEYEGGKIPAFVNIEGRSPEKSTMYPMTSALLGQDAKEYSEENGPVKPSELVFKECWVRANTVANEDGTVKTYLNEFKAELPAIQYSTGKAAQPKTPLGTRAQQPPQATGKSPF